MLINIKLLKANFKLQIAAKRENGENQRFNSYDMAHIFGFLQIGHCDHHPHKVLDFKICDKQVTFPT